MLAEVPLVPLPLSFANDSTLFRRLAKPPHNNSSRCGHRSNIHHLRQVIRPASTRRVWECACGCETVWCVVRAAASLLLSRSLPSVFSVDSSPSTVNDAFYAGVKTLFAKTALPRRCLRFIERRRTSSNDPRNDLQFSHRVAARALPFLRAPTLQSRGDRPRTIVSIYRRLPTAL